MTLEFFMTLEFIVLLTLGLIGYFRLSNVIRKRSITGCVVLFIDSMGGKVTLKKYTTFVMTPVPGMEYIAGGIEGAEIERVLIDDHGFPSVICQLTLADLSAGAFEDTIEHLLKDGWHKTTYRR